MTKVPTQPLAYRMRPRNIDEIIGQQHIIGPGTMLYKSIQHGVVPPILLYGEPGLGKTSIAYAIAGTVHQPFAFINATTDGIKELKALVERAKKERDESGRGIVCMVDEIHRFNKTQQDALLPHVESGLITLIGCTTENPYHSVLPAIRSRCGMIKEVKRMTPKEVASGLRMALEDEERGLASYHPVIDDALLEAIGQATNGEMRSALSILELSTLATDPDEEGRRFVKEEVIRECAENKGFSHDKGGDAHYDTLSAFQKSIRGSDVDASLHYLARLIEAGDLVSICRRLVVIAYEDVSLASPDAGMKTLAATEAAVRLGFPEARIPLANAVVDLCLSPKSNAAYKALDRAIADVKAGKMGEIPPHLKDSHYASASKMGKGVGYLYPHQYPIGGSIGVWVPQQYLPDALVSRSYFEAGHSERDKKLEKWYRMLKEKQNPNTP